MPRCISPASATDAQHLLRASSTEYSQSVFVAVHRLNADYATVPILGDEVEIASTIPAVVYSVAPNYNAGDGHRLALSGVSSLSAAL